MHIPTVNTLAELRDAVGFRREDTLAPIEHERELVSFSGSGQL